MAATLTIYYERKLSDGDYGSEGLSMGITVELSADGSSELDDGTSAQLYARLRRNVLGHLTASRARRVAAVASAELGELKPDMEELPFDDDPPF
jgi:hypothetical protein